MRRPIFVAAVSVGTFITALVALVVMPQQARRAAKAILPRPGERPDTLPLALNTAIARNQFRAAESAIAGARVRAVVAAKTAINTLSPAALAKRDSLETAAAALEKLLARAENAPLAASYRALSESPGLAGDPRVRTLLDSLGEIEKEREGFGAVGGVDPVFVALTSRATEIGRAIEAIGEQRRDSLRRGIVALAPVRTAPAVASLTIPDTDALIAGRDSARTRLERDTTELTRQRQKVIAVDARIQRAREVATVSAPPFALLAAALVFGVVLGFGSALSDELRHPRIANAHEAERFSGVRVLGVVEPRPPSPDRNRRSADRAAPPYMDPGASGHQLVYLHVATSGTNLLMLTVAGEEAAIAAVVATNLAAIASEEAKNTLLVDVDPACNIPAMLRVRAQPGIVDIVDGTVTWPEATVQKTVGRDRTIDVVPSGTALPLPTVAEIAAILKQDSPRLGRHYDAVIILVSAKQALSGISAGLPIPDVIYCARVGRTRLASLRKAIESLAQTGARPVGVVLWNAPPPTLPAAAELATAPRPQRTAAPRMVAAADV